MARFAGTSGSQDADMASSSSSRRGLFLGDWGTPDKITLLAETYTVFAGLQQIDASRHGGANGTAAGEASVFGKSVASSSALPQVQTMSNYHRVSALYRAGLMRYKDKLAAYETPDLDDIQVAADIHAVFHLAEMLYLPADGTGAGVVGEEVLNWLNAYDVAPTTEEGQDIASAETPYEHPRYWDYILQCVLRGFNKSAATVLENLTSHQSKVVARIARKAIKLLQTCPRSTSYSHEASFIQDRKTWQAQVRQLLQGLENEMDEMEEELGRTDAVEDQRIEYEAQYRCLLELMAGVRERVFEACSDWKEALGAWGLLVQPTMRRDDIPDVMSSILEKLPADLTLPHEKASIEFAKGDVGRATRSCRDFDPWLAAHLTDLLARAELLLDDEKGDTLRKEGVKEYAEVLLDDQGLWRMALDYLATIGPEVRRQMSNLVLDVSLDLDKVDESKGQSQDEEMEGEDEQEGEGKQKQPSEIPSRFKRVEELLRACVDHAMEDEARAICKIAAEELTHQRDFGTAVAYCVRAGDATQVRRIADLVLNEYIYSGAAEFVALVDTFPQSLLQPTSRLPDAASTGDQIFGTERSLYSERLAFLGKYRDFHKLYAEERLHEAAAVLISTLMSNQAPERFWAILLLDSIPLLESDLMLFEEDGVMELIRYYEQVTTSARAHPQEAEHYLGMMETLLQKSQDKPSKGKTTASPRVNVDAALKRLEVVRLGLARCLSKAFQLENSRIYSL